MKPFEFDLLFPESCAPIDDVSRALWASGLVPVPTASDSGGLCLRQPLDPRPPCFSSLRCFDGVGTLEAEEVVAQTRSRLVVSRQEPGGDPRTQRKHTLSVLHAALGESGLAVYDRASGLLWTRDLLDIETSHEGDLDTLQIFDAHLVRSEAGIWLHTHGLAELGGVDFDVLDPGPVVTRQLELFLRSFATLGLRGRLLGDRLRLPGGVGEVALVPVEEFNAQATPRWRDRVRDTRCAGHNRGPRVVLCEPGKARPTPAACLRAEAVLPLELDVCELDRMRARAAATLPLLRDLRDEYQDYVERTLVEVSLGASAGFTEVACVEVEELGEASLTGWALAAHGEEEFNVLLPVDSIQDWELTTPLGSVTPRDMRIPALLRVLHEEFLERTGGVLH